MDDRELLEMAAKAAGYAVERPSDEDGVFVMRGRSERAGHIWNPLDEDGDALRLAVKLKLQVTITEWAVHVADLEKEIMVRVGLLAKDRPMYNFDEATRRAIARAAAEIGRSMP